MVEGALYSFLIDIEGSSCFSIIALTIKIDVFQHWYLKLIIVKVSLQQNPVLLLVKPKLFSCNPLNRK